MNKRSLAGALATWVPLCAALPVSAAEYSRATFGVLDGQPVEAVTLSNSHGVRVTLMTLGAAVQTLIVPDRDGKPADIVLGYNTPQEYVDKPQYFGATVGRFANRLARGRFTLDGKTYQLAINNAPNALHGGLKGFDKVIWRVARVSGGADAAVTFTYVSPDGDQGYPGALSVSATYSLNEDNELSLEYRATTDKATIVNLSNHSYFNLSGEGAGDVMQQRLTLPAAEFTPVDATSIPTGEFRVVAGTDFDFRRAKAIGHDVRDGREQQLLFGKGYDHNFVVSRAPVAVPRLVARVEDPASGRVMEILSNQPGIQFYSGNFLDGQVVGKSGRAYRQGDAFVLEPQLFPDTPNQPTLGSARLDPGSTYLNQIVYRFSTVKATP